MTDIVFMGTPELSAVILKALIEEGYNVQAVVTQPDRPSGRRRQIVFSPVKELALEHGLKLLQPENISDPEFMQELEELEPLLIITAAYGRILPSAILDIPHAAINVHASLLPKYRGASPIQRCIYDGRDKTGVTIMLMDEGMDTGDILSKREVDIPGDADGGELTETLAQAGAELLLETIPAFLIGQILPQKQDETKATTIKPVVKKEGKVDWTKTSRQIHDLIRGSLPWPVAFTFYDKKRVNLIKSRILTSEEEKQILEDPEIKALEPGSLIIEDRKTRILVRSGDGIVEILNIKMAGCRDLCSHECAHNFETGKVFGGDCP